MTETTLAERKARLREHVRGARRMLDRETRTAAHGAISERLAALPELSGVTTLLSYRATPEEADPSQAEDVLRARGVRVALPRVTSSNVLELRWHEEAAPLAKSPFGIFEPTDLSPMAAPSEIDAVIVPGVAFDSRCSRLGYGGGYYDRLIPLLPARATAVGIAYDEQLVDSLPVSESDVPTDVLVTPTAVYRRREG